MDGERKRRMIEDGNYAHSQRVQQDGLTGAGEVDCAFSFLVLGLHFAMLLSVLGEREDAAIPTWRGNKDE